MSNVAGSVCCLGWSIGGRWSATGSWWQESCWTYSRAVSSLLWTIACTTTVLTADYLARDGLLNFSVYKAYVMSYQTYTPCLKKNCANLFFAPCLSNMNRFQ